MAKPAPKRGKNKDNARRSKKKISILTTEKIEYLDWKDVNLMRRFLSDRSKIRARRVTGNDAQQQREVSQAVKRAREMALIPYASRVTTQRRGARRDDRDGDRGPRRDDDRGPRRDDDRGPRRDDRDGPRGGGDDQQSSDSAAPTSEAPATPPETESVEA